jgi:hypothetical protein
MPKLAIEYRPSLVDSVNNLLPRDDLFFLPNTRGVRPFRTIELRVKGRYDSQLNTLPKRTYLAGFSDNHACSGTLLVVLCNQFIGDICRNSAIASERGHEDPILHGLATDCNRLKENAGRGHRQELWGRSSGI